MPGNDSNHKASRRSKAKEKTLIAEASERLKHLYQTEMAKKENILAKYFDTRKAIFLGAGSFGHVFLVRALTSITFEDFEELTKKLTKDDKHDIINNVKESKLRNIVKTDVALEKNAEVAIKFESAREYLQPDEVPNEKSSSQNLGILDESRVLVYKEFNVLIKIFNKFGFKHTRGFTKPYAFGKLGNFYVEHALESSNKKKIQIPAFHFLIFEFCGPDIENMMDYCSFDCSQRDQRLSPRTVFMIGDQLISRLETMQSLELVHNDLKTDQLMPGAKGNANCIYLIDFGLVQKYSDIRNSEVVAANGNKRWAPRSHHRYRPRTPLCEIESACYVLLRLLKNCFPWDGVFDDQERQAAANKANQENDQDKNAKSGDEASYTEKQYLWNYLKFANGKKSVIDHLPPDLLTEVLKFQTFFAERNDRWNDGGSQMLELMKALANMAHNDECEFKASEVNYDSVDYISLRGHLLTIFDLSMYDRSLNNTGVDDRRKAEIHKFFESNKKSNDKRTEHGRPVYYYFPEGDTNCYWDWYLRYIDLHPKKPKYWQILLANRAELRKKLMERQGQAPKNVAEQK